MAKGKKRYVAPEPIPLLNGAYQNRSLIAGAQREVNLYPENNPPDSQAPVPTTHYQTPGLELKGAPAAVVDPWRGCGLYLATNGELFGIVGSNVYYIDSVLGFTLVGAIAAAVSPVSMKDNGIVLVIVDGTTNGYAIDLATHAFGAIGAGYQAANKVDFMDTYFLFNVAGTNQWYISLSNVDYAMLTGGTAFDPLDVAAKTSSPDDIASLVVVNSQVWLLGALFGSEVWINSGAVDFPFERQPGGIIAHGIGAIYSPATADRSAYFLMKDRDGNVIVAQTVEYALQKISTYAVDQAIQSYDIIDDAIGYCRQQEGHAFYVLQFPTANKTWVCELASMQWHEWETMDGNGHPNRHRSNCYANAYKFNLVGDYANANLYSLEVDVFTDNGVPIRRLRTFPHLIADGRRQQYLSFMANMEVGQSTDPADDPQVTLRFSDDRGASFSNGMIRSLGKTGEYKKSIKWTRLGMARDRVFELSWSANCRTALNGAFVTAQPLSS